MKATKAAKPRKTARKKSSGQSQISGKDQGFFAKAANAVSRWAGSSYVFLTAAGVVVIWAVSGPIFDYSDTWQLVINTGTTIVTFLMVFLIQNTQNRDTKALQLKLDEIIRATEGAHTALLDLEELSEEELQSIQNRYEELASKARDMKRKGKSDVHILDVKVD